MHRVPRLRPGRIAVLAASIAAIWAAPAGADTTVSLTFDDGNADQMPAVQMLANHGMKGTFYIIPGRVGRPNSQYMTWANVQTIYNAGNEIGGHTRNHVHLTDVSESTARTEICGGRDDLLAKGYPQISFAYPFGDHDSTSEDLVQECGYLSGRGVGGLRDDGEPDADTIPPRNPWVLPTPGSIDIDDTLPKIKQYIMDAEAAGASQPSWISLVIHHLCDPDVTDCSDPDGVDDAYITPQDFDSLLDWLQARELTGTHVERVEDVMTGQTSDDTTPPVTQIKCDNATCQSGFYNHNVSVTLAATDAGGSGLKEIHYTTDGTNPTTSSPKYTGPITVSSTTANPIKYRAWDNAGNAEATKQQTISIDKAVPTSSIQCNGTACSSGFYNGTVSATLTASDTGGSGPKNIRYTTDGTNPTAASPVYTAAIPVSSNTTIKWRAEDNAGNVESIHSQVIQIDKVKPTSSILCDGAPCQASYDHPVSATLATTDTGGSGPKNIRYTTDGTNPTAASPVYTAAIPVSSNTTIKWRAEDNAGNVESVHTQAIIISIDAASPTSSILCDGAPCQATYDHPVAATLSAIDSGGSGLKNIRYTTDGSTPTATSPIYTDPINVASTTTIRYRGEDNAGNIESIKSQTIEIISPSPPPPSGGEAGGSAGGTLGAFSSFKSLPNGTAKLTVEVTGPGELQALDGAVTKAAAAAGKKLKHRIKRTTRSVTQAGLVTLTIRPSKSGRRILRGKGKLAVPVRVIFTPATGSQAAQTIKLKLRLR
jgi:peptidoglycan/xylan/chitin deacetylase (PgdA/CDA1 family)